MVPRGKVTEEIMKECSKMNAQCSIKIPHQEGFK